jgi:hypothetical protein
MPVFSLTSSNDLKSDTCDEVALAVPIKHVRKSVLCAKFKICAIAVMCRILYDLLVAFALHRALVFRLHLPTATTVTSGFPFESM